MRIGVVIPAYNAAAWVGDAIASVLAQTHREWQLVVVDDGSTDATTEVVVRLADGRIRLIRQRHAGVSAARNCATMRLADQPWARRGRDDSEAVLFLDADDWLAPEALERLAAALDAAPHAVAASGAFTYVGTGTIRKPPSGELLEPLLVRNLFANGGHLLLRAEAVRRAGGFRPELSYGEDWEFWIRVALQGPFASTEDDKPVLFVRQRGDGAYQRLAADPASFVPCMEAIFSNPALLVRFGAERLREIRSRTEAENNWIIGRELIRHGRNGRPWLRRSVLAHPSSKRLALLAASHVLPLLPLGWRGPFLPYRLKADAQPHAPRPAGGWCKGCASLAGSPAMPRGNTGQRSQRSSRS